MQSDYTPRRRLSEILAGDFEAIREQWNETEAAPDRGPVPSGTYEAHVDSVKLFNARTGTAGVKIRFDVCEGEYTGRAVFHDLWITPAALPHTKRDVEKLGLGTFEELDSAEVTPGRIRCRVCVALRTGDNGTQYNGVRSFDVIGIDGPEPDAFAPVDDSSEGPAPGGKHKAPPVDGPQCAEGEVPAEVDAGSVTDCEGGPDVPF